MLKDKPCANSQVNTIAEYFLCKTAVKKVLRNRLCFWHHSDGSLSCCEWVEVGLICIFIESTKLRQGSYI